MSRQASFAGVRREQGPMVVVPSRMRGLNRRSLVQRLQRLGTASRADLAKSLGMSAPTAGKIVDELLAAGVLEEAEEGVPEGEGLGGQGVARLGRPARRLRLARAQRRFLGIEVGVTQTFLAALPVGVREADGWEIQVRTGGSVGEWLEGLAEAARRLPKNDYWGVLVSVPGIVDEAAGRVLFSPNLHWTEGADLKELLQRHWPFPVELVQEERALALGQQLIDPLAEDFLLVDFGEGVGGAIVLGGRVYRSTLTINGELGHTPVLGNDRTCGCGGTGCVETLVSMSGLLQSYQEARPRGRGTWEALMTELAAGGIPRWLDHTLEAVGNIIAGALNVLGLRRVVLTGSVTELGAEVTQRLAAAVARGAMWGRFGEVVCQSAPRRRMAGLVAAGIDRLVLPADGLGHVLGGVELGKVNAG